MPEIEIKNKNRNKIIIGALLLGFSFASFILPESVRSIPLVYVVLHGMILSGIIILSEGITLSIKNKSLLREILRNKNHVLNFLIISTISALLLEGLGKWLGKLWIYPDFPFAAYLILFIPAFAVYWMAIVESYLAVKAVLDLKIRGTHQATKPFRTESGFFDFIFVLGLIFIAVSLLNFYTSYNSQNFPIIVLGDYLSVTNSFQFNYFQIILLSLGLWFILEYIEFIRKKTSLLKDIIHSFWSPALAILLGSFILAIIMEPQNIPLDIWRYVNFPWEHITFLTFPVSLFVLWPVHYVVFLSLFRAFGDKESREIWAGDFIE